MSPASHIVLIVSEDPAIRDSLSELVDSAGLRVRVASSLEASCDSGDAEPAACMVLDTGARGLIDSQRRARFAEACARLPVLVLTDRGDVLTAVQAVRQGAADVIQKPCRNENLLDRIERAVTDREQGNSSS